MSRTYRLRHLPRLRARKFLSGVSRLRREKLDNEVWRRVAHDHIGVPCVSEDHHDCIRCCDHNWSVYSLFHRYQKDVVYPVARPWDHPWVSWCWAENSQKRYYSTLSHRLARRKVHQVLNDPNFDFESTMLVTSDDYFDPWDFD